jgi:hypothetical protein
MRVRLLLAGALALSLATPARAGGRWPTRRQYIDAMYNAHQFLRDPKLAGARVERDHRNQPLYYGGSFSTAFRIKSKSGRPLALRVFHPDEGVVERQSVDAVVDRYRKIGGFFDKLARSRRLPPELIEFAMVRNGISIGGERLPILKMPWVSGRTLDDWIDTRLSQGRSKSVKVLAGNWRALMRDLRDVGIAHGDLHPGNIKLEPSGAMRLLDYDGMYVPPLAGLTNSEIGQVNFQHPAYHFPSPSPRAYNADMDNFSAIVIYTSLLAIADNPSLWRKYHNESTLIFDSERDFVDPDRSPVLRDIAASKDPVVRNMGKALARFARGAPEAVPPLERAIEAASKPWYQRQGAGQQ